jgi:hypothetical protein
MVDSGGRTVFRVRALGGNEKFLRVARETVGPKIVGHGDIIHDACIEQASPFS